MKDQEEGATEGGVGDEAQLREKEPSFSIEIEVKPGFSERRLSEDGKEKGASGDVEMEEA